MKNNAAIIKGFFAVFALIFLVVSVMGALTSCSPALTDEEAKEILEEKLPTSYNVLAAIYGELLYCSDEDKAKIDEGWTTPHYFTVDDSCIYKTIAEIKKDAEKVFTPTYLEAVYEYAFEGNDEAMSRFAENEGRLTIDVVKEPYGVLTNIYPETVKVVKSSRYSAVITVDGSADGGKTVKSITINLSCINGNWLFNSPTY